MASSSDVDTLVRSLSHHHTAFTTDMENVVCLLKLYKKRSEELEALLATRNVEARDAATQTNVGDDAVADPTAHSFLRVDRRTISESGVQMSWEMDRQMQNAFPDIWNFDPSLVNLGLINESIEGWSQSLNTSHPIITPPLWAPFSGRDLSPQDSETPSENSIPRVAISDNCDNDADFDLSEIQQAIRESTVEEMWQLAGEIKSASNEKKQSQLSMQAERKVPRRGKVASESSIIQPRAGVQEERKKNPKHTVTDLPQAFLGRWLAVKFCTAGGPHDGLWRDMPSPDKKKEPRVAIKQGSKAGTYHVTHSKFVIKDAIFYEHCGGQRCIVLKDRANTILMRNKQLTHTFCIQANGQLMEIFKDGCVEHKILSEKSPE